MNKLLLSLSVATGLLLSSASTFAACVAGDLKGKLFTLYITNEYQQEFSDGDNIFYNQVQRCTFKVLPSGFVRLNDKCYNSSGQYFAYVSGGKLGIKRNCQVVGNIFTEHNGGTLRIRFRHARMDRGKTMIVGQANVVDSSQLNDSSSPFQMIKH